MAYIFKGDFETGDGSQYDGLNDHTTNPSIYAGTSQILTTYTAPTSGQVITPNSGSTTVAMNLLTMKPPASGQSADRTERVKSYDYSQYHTLTFEYTFAIMLHPDFDWTSAWTADATNDHYHPVVAQILTRNLQSASVLVLVHPAGWQGASAVSLAPVCWGGITNPGSTPTTEHRLAVASDWTTLIDPATAGSTSATRYPQWIGPNTQMAGNIPFTKGVWHEIKLVVNHQTSSATGFYQVWYRLKGSGATWTQTVGTTSIYKTVQWQSGTQPVNSSGANNTHRFGGYVYGLPQQIQILLDQFTISNTDTDANNAFASETGGGTGGGGAPSTVSFVQGTAAGAPTGTPVSTYSITFNAPVTAGNLITGMAVWNNASDEALSSVTDSLGNTYTLGSHANAGGATDGQLFTAPVTTGGTCTVTMHMAGSRAFPNLAVQEITGQSASSPLDKQAIVSQIGGTGTDHMTSGSVTTTADGEYISGWLYNVNAAAPTFAAGTGFTARMNNLNGTYIEDAGQTSAGAVAATFTISSTTGTYFVAVQTIKPSIPVPVNTVAPAVTGTIQVGSVLTSTHGTWVNQGTAVYTYQWQRDNSGDGTWSNIGSATAATHTLVSGDNGDMIRCVVTNTDAFGAVTANSNAVGLITTAGPSNTVPPVASGTTLQVTTTVSCTAGTWTDVSGAKTYQWQRDVAGNGVFSNIGSATSSGYTLVVADDGNNIRCVVTDTDVNGATPANSNSLGPILDAPFVPPVQTATTHPLGAGIKTTATETDNNVRGIGSKRR